MTKKILIATDAFKGALPAFKVGQAIQKGWQLADNLSQIKLFPLADGGEGTAEILTYHNITQFEQHLASANLVITSEGKLDKQTLHGKLIAGICKKAKLHHVPVVALCGKLDLSPKEIEQLGLQATFSINTQAENLAEALKKTADNLSLTSYNIARIFKQQ